MSDTPPAPPTKSFLLSKTLWLQVILFFLAFFPPVLAWIQANPVELVAVIGALNVLMRFATSGRVSLFPPEEVDKNSGGGSGGIAPLVSLGGWIALGTAAVMGFLPSCLSVAEYPLTAGVTWREPNTGAKAGIYYSPRKPLTPVVKVLPIYDPETGEEIGTTTFRVDPKSSK